MSDPYVEALADTMAGAVSDWLAPTVRRTDDGGVFLTVTAADRPGGVVDLSGVLPNRDLTVEVIGAAPYERTPIRFSGLNGDSTVKVLLGGSPGAILLTQHAGTLLLWQEFGRKGETAVFVGPDVSGRLILDQGSFAFAVDPATARELSIDVWTDANVPFIGWLPDLTVYDTVRPIFRLLDSSGRVDGSIPCPAVRGLSASRELAIRITAGAAAARTMDVAALVAAVRPDRFPDPPMLEIVGGSTVVLEAATNVSIGHATEGNEPFGLDVTGTAGLSNVFLQGPAQVLVQADSRVAGLGSHPYLGANELSAAPATVVSGLAGPWRLNEVAGTHVSGGPRGFELVGIAAFSESRADTVRDAVVTGFSLPSPTERRSAVAALEAAHHVDPRTSALPGAGRRYRWPRPLFLRRAPEMSARLAEDAEFVDALARLAREKGAPGATRTKIAWCAYRLRHLAARSVWERLTLAGYRLLGYGERPAPALLCWLLLAVLSAAVSVWAVDPQASAIDEFLSYAFAPAGVLMRTGATAEPHAWQYLLRAVVAVPLVTGLIALRNFVKQGRA